MFVCQSGVKTTVWKEIVANKDSAIGEFSFIVKSKLIYKVEDKLSKCGVHSTRHVSMCLSDAGLGLPTNFSVTKKQLCAFWQRFNLSPTTLCLHPVRKDSGYVLILMSTTAVFWYSSNIVWERLECLGLRSVGRCLNVFPSCDWYNYCAIKVVLSGFSEMTFFSVAWNISVNSVSYMSWLPVWMLARSRVWLVWFILDVYSKSRSIASLVLTTVFEEIPNVWLKYRYLKAGQN